MVKIAETRFVKSGTKPAHYPEWAWPEVAFAGRSNVGKSSLMNTLMERRDLVRVSKRPGATQLLNFFEARLGGGDTLGLVDLPGYGFARVPIRIRDSWGKMIERYLVERQQLKGMVVVMDLRRGIEDDDMQLISSLQRLGVPPILVFTKADKLSRNKANTQLRAIARDLGWKPSDLLAFSSHTGAGRDALWKTLLHVAFPPKPDFAYSDVAFNNPQERDLPPDADAPEAPAPEAPSEPA